MRWEGVKGNNVWGGGRGCEETMRGEKEGKLEMISGGWKEGSPEAKTGRDGEGKVRWAGQGELKMGKG